MSETEEEPCPTCGKMFQSGRGVSSHHAQVHGESIAGVEYECENCGDRFRARDRDYKKYCSKKCMAEDYIDRKDIGGISENYDYPSGQEHPNWVEKKKVECEKCNREFKCYEHESKRKYCSRECAYEDLRKREIINCRNCNVEFEKLKNQEHPFCSYDCAMDYRTGIIDEEKWETKQCKECEKDFDSYKNYNRKYCSNICKSKSLKGRKLSKEHKKKIAENLMKSFKENQEHIEELGHKVRSSWEEDVAWFLYENDINYEYEPRYYDLEDEFYVPDFIISDIVIEVKGYCHGDDSRKAKKFMQRYPMYEYIVIGDKNMPCDIHFDYESYKENIGELL